MRYMLFIKHIEDYRGKQIPPGLMEAMGQFVGDNFKAGKFIDAAGLKSTHRARKVQLRNGQLRVVDGPFSESKEIIGGYTLIEAASDEEALELAKGFMELHKRYWPDFQGEAELRVIETGMPASE